MSGDTAHARPAGPVARVLLALLVLYQRGVSPLLGPRCRFSPTCSAYAAEAVRSRGALVGSGLALRRLARCHPFHPGGYDPVPPLGRRAAAASATMDPATPAAAHDPLHRPLHHGTTRPGPGG